MADGTTNTDAPVVAVVADVTAKRVPYPLFLERQKEKAPDADISA